MDKLKAKNSPDLLTVDELAFITDLLDANGEDEVEDQIAEWAQNETKEETPEESDL